MGRHPLLRDIPYKMTAEDVKNRVMEHLAKLPYAFWENQFNLFDSHDVSRLHNNPKIHPQEYRGAVFFQFMLTGAASIYYGDEAGVDGVTGTNEGCRYTMPWDKDFESGEMYKLYQTMAHLKQDHKALRSGGMKFLYAQDGIVALARFCGEEAFVSVMSTNAEAKTVRLPLGAIGAAGPKGDADIFGNVLTYEKTDENSIVLTVPGHQAYLMECLLK